MNEKYNILSVNGEFVAKANFHLSIDNRAFRYGDGLFETMHANGRQVQFLPDHYNRIQKGAEVLGLKLPLNFSVEYLQKHIESLLNRCKLYQGAKVRIFINRKSGGLYIPQNNDVDIIIEAEYLSKGAYELNKKGLVLGLFTDFPKPKSPFSDFKSLNALPYVLAGKYAVDKGFDDCLITNEKGFFIEATSSNVFCVKDKVIYTPTAESSCVKGVMRKNIMHIIKCNGFKVVNVRGFSKEELLIMDEIFLTNAVSGILWVSGINQKRYYKKISAKILDLLNKVSLKVESKK